MATENLICRVALAFQVEGVTPNEVRDMLLQDPRLDHGDVYLALVAGEILSRPVETSPTSP